MIEINYKSIGARIKARRIQKKMTQERLAELCDVTTQHISNVENDKTKVSLPLLIAIANALETSLDELVCDSLVHADAVYAKEIELIFSLSTPEDKRFLIASLKSTKKALDEYKLARNNRSL